MTDQELIKQLKSAKTAYDKKFAPTPEAVERIQGLLMARINGDGSKMEPSPVSVSRIGFIFGFLRYITPPQFAYALGFLALFAVSGVFAAYAQRALPGQTLYGAKIALEQTHVRFVSNPANRAQVQMELAGRRLEEAGALESSEGEEKALRQFSRDIKEAQNTLKQAGDPVQVKAATLQLAKKAKEYEEKLTETKSKKPVRVREVDLAAMKEAEDLLKEIQLEEVQGETVEEVPASDEPKTEEKVKEQELQEGEVSL